MPLATKDICSLLFAEKDGGDTSALRAQNYTPAPTATPTCSIISSATTPPSKRTLIKPPNAAMLCNFTSWTHELVTFFVGSSG
ncbi:hypothetical protein PC116_g20665 [Phytophthora cactorum]|nr:hypothetical protein Pcac1_g15753 [Phytophthora cactorum]KAG3003662.1 hypothetical protein PC119_g15878 [Phytophthora cactorum]KAG3010406.1 hypothetical protein PC120_g15065 [Phytophthora cactorum]KAG3181114.1 hypothetical protein PC128_g15273 [Phytophthora cactorum]KAG4049531.1 hypothetical protein PC123_g15184 [Phytophthora cactorum]